MAVDERIEHLRSVEVPDSLSREDLIELWRTLRVRQELVGESIRLALAVGVSEAAETMLQPWAGAA